MQIYIVSYSAVIKAAKKVASTKFRVRNSPIMVHS